MLSKKVTQIISRIIVGLLIFSIVLGFIIPIFM